LDGTSPESRVLNTYITADTVTASGALTHPAAWADVPVKSTRASPLPIVSWHAILSGSRLTPSSSRKSANLYLPRGSDRMNPRIILSAYSWSAVEARVSSPLPREESISASRLLPSSFAANCARTSPARSSGVRTLASRRFNTSAFILPRLTSRVGGMMSPSW